MWCRALLTATLLACTFLRSHAQSQHTKDLLCVLILSGLQKEDLDVALLRKLLRHNVNVEDLDNPNVRNDCLPTFENKASSRRKGNQEIESLKKDIVVNNTLNIAEQKNEVKSAKDEKSMTDLMKLIKTLKTDENKTKTKQDNKESKSSQMSSKILQLLQTPAPPKLSNKEDTNTAAYLSKILERLMAQTKTTTAPPTTTASPKTTPFDLASLVNDIKYMIESRGRNKTSSNDAVKKKNDVKTNHNEEVASNKHDKKNNMNTANVNLLLQEAMKHYDMDKKVDNSLFKPSRSTTKAGAKQMSVDVIPSNIIKDIAESVKALVLQDLKKEMSTMQSIVTETTSMPTTDHDSALIRDATIAFAEFVQLFQHLKTTLMPITDKNIVSQMKRHSMRDLRNPLTASITTLTTGSLLKNELTNLNTELESMPVYKNSINRIEQLNIFNHRNDMNPPPITIQSNVNQIPPLTIPVIDSPVKMVYQNIIVTSESPFDYFKNMHRNQVYVSNTKSLYNDNKKYTTKIKAPSRSDIEIIRDYRENDSRPTFHSIKNEGYIRPRHQIGRDYHIESRKTPSYDDNYIEYNYRTSHPNHGGRTRNNNIERFHEKLERTNEWSQVSSERNNNNKIRIGSRHLLPLNDKKRSKYDDTHFKNFLKTQQKVNDMLERILATKTISEGTRSVETS